MDPENLFHLEKAVKGDRSRVINLTKDGVLCNEYLNKLVFTNQPLYH